MKKIKRAFTILLSLVMLLQLCACGKTEQTNDIIIIEDDAKEDELPIVTIGQPQVSAELEPGYITTELVMPEGYENFGGLQSAGDKLYLHGTTQEENFSVFQYDTITGEWQRWSLDTKDAKYAKIDGFSVVEGTVWIRLFEEYSDNEVCKLRLCNFLCFALSINNFSKCLGIIRHHSSPRTNFTILVFMSEFIIVSI